MPEHLSPSRSQRVVSLDVFRGLNLALMIFVNELGEIKGLPWWTYHAPGQVDAMTYVDMVFPGFLFIVGMSMPLALRARERRGDGTGRLVWYVVLRSVALLVLGLVLSNGERGSSSQMHGLGRFAWGLLALFGAGLVWFDYPASGESLQRRRWYAALRVVGVLLLLGLAIVFRHVAEDGSVGWIDFGYPEILGLIGYSYLVAGLCFLLTRRWRWAPAGWFVAFAVLNVLSAAKVLQVSLPWWLWPVQNGSMPTLVFAGVVLSVIFFMEPRLVRFRSKAACALLFGVMAVVAAWAALPLGISKIRATPTWVLCTIAACCAVFPALYWMCDVKRWRAWATPVRSAGSNTLLTYLLPDVWFYATGLASFHWWSEHFSSGLPGVARALVFTAAMLALSALLTKMRVRLQL